MKPTLTVTPDNRPAGIRVMLASRKGHILYDRATDRTKKRPGGARIRQGKRVTNDSRNSLPRIEDERNEQQSEGL